MTLRQNVLKTVKKPASKGKQALGKKKKTKKGFVRHGLFLFKSDCNLQESIESSMVDGLEHEKQMLQLMYMYQTYHNIAQIRQYASRGSKLICEYGTKPAVLDTLVDHGVYAGTRPVMTCADCERVNLHDFGSCMCPERFYENRLPMTVAVHRNGTMAEQAPYNKYPHICVPLVNTQAGWYQAETGVFIEETNGVAFQALLDDAFLVCQYGGKITIPEVPTDEEGNNEIKSTEYVTLEMMKQLEWNQIHCGYRRKDSNIESPIDELDVEITRRHRDIEQEKDINKINSLFDRFKINTKKRICAFFAECSAETSSGQGLVEQAYTKGDVEELNIKYLFTKPATRRNLKEWFDDNRKYKYLYRGGGVIQLTWEEHYTGFQKWYYDNFGVDDNNIVDLGAEYVATTYPWESAVYFWDDEDLNHTADDIVTIDDIEKITNVVNLNMTTEEKVRRKNAFEKWMNAYPDDSQI